MARGESDRSWNTSSIKEEYVLARRHKSGTNDGEGVEDLPSGRAFDCLPLSCTSSVGTQLTSAFTFLWELLGRYFRAIRPVRWRPIPRHGS